MALKTSILSAIGSRNLPKFVTIFRSRANFPSMWSVRDAMAKINSAHTVEYGISPHSINRTKNGTSTIRNTVSLFAVFISFVPFYLRCAHKNPLFHSFTMFIIQSITKKVIGQQTASVQKYDRFQNCYLFGQTEVFVPCDKAPDSIQFYVIVNPQAMCLLLF